MYYIAKLFQAAGLIIILVAFVENFPDVMNYRTLGVGLSMFIAGWIIQARLLKR